MSKRRLRPIALSRAVFAGLCSALALAAGAAQAADPTVAPGYNLSVFAGPLAGSSNPDSIAIVGSNVFVGYGNTADKTGLSGSSTIAEYTGSGAFVDSIQMAGHNDGLRYDSATGRLWALQNEDGNPTLAFINPTNLHATTPLALPPVNGGGYDDVAFGPNGRPYISASNPSKDPNADPAIVSASVAGSMITVHGVLAGNAMATVVNDGSTTLLNLQDPDSLIFAPDGRLVLDSQSDQQLVFVSHVGQPSQSVSVLNLPSTVDDTVFGKGGHGQLLFADRDSGNIYSLTGDFGPGAAYSASDTLNEIVHVNLANGSFTALVSGLNSPHGEAFTAVVPEAATWAMMLVGFAGLGYASRRSRKGDRIQL